MNQAQVREIYLRVIDATIEGVRAEFVEKGVGDSVLESLALLKSRWSTRLTHTRDFTDDPTVVDKPPASAKGGKKVAKSGAKTAAKKASPKPAPKPAPNTTSSQSTRNGVISVASLTNDTDDFAGPPLPPVPRTAAPPGMGKPELVVKPEVIAIEDDQPPLKRQRVTIDDDDDINRGEDLDSSDSDEGGDSEDEAAENLVLAQHDRVRKGPKWKVILREGIVSIRGREYLFNKATCDLDF